MEPLKFPQKPICNDFCCTKIENLSVTIGNNNILNDVNLHFHCGELTSIIGPNGAGKSTLLKAILEEIPHTGQLIFESASSTKELKPILGYVPQYLNFDLSTPASVLDLFIACNSKVPAWLISHNKFRNRVIDNLTKVKIPHLIDRKLGALSGGELQRVLLALALDPIPNILLLDEPVSGIDQNGLDLFYNLLLEIKKTFDLSIVLVSHDLDLVSKYADKIVLLEKTILCSGSPKEVFNHKEAKRIFGLHNFEGKGR